MADRVLLILPKHFDDLVRWLQRHSMEGISTALLMVKPQEVNRDGMLVCFLPEQMYLAVSMAVDTLERNKWGTLTKRVKPKICIEGGGF